MTATELLANLRKLRNEILADRNPHIYNTIDGPVAETQAERLAECDQAIEVLSNALAKSKLDEPPRSAQRAA